jgi:hypothetical protein
MNKSYKIAIFGDSGASKESRLCYLVLFHHVKLRAASEKICEERCSEQGWGDKTGKEGYPCPEGGGDGRAIQQGGSGSFGPPSGGEEQGSGEGSGEQPAGVVTGWHAVIDAALRPHPESQGGCARVEDGIHPDEEQGCVEDVQET